MPLEAFRDYYEGVHSKLCAKLMIGVSRYVRRYVEPRPKSLTGKDDELEFDLLHSRRAPQIPDIKDDQDDDRSCEQRHENRKPWTVNRQRN